MSGPTERNYFPPQRPSIATPPSADAPTMMAAVRAIALGTFRCECCNEVFPVVLPDPELEPALDAVVVCDDCAWSIDFNLAEASS